MVMLVLFALIASSFAQVPCTQGFFQNVKVRAAGYVRDQGKPWNISSAATGIAAATARGTVESVQQYGQMHVERQAIFSQAYRSGEYLRGKVHGRPLPSPAAAAKVFSTRQLLARLGFQALIAAEVYFYMDPSPKRCNATIEGWAKTQEIVNGQCVDKIAFSENNVNFLSRPLEDQEKLAAQFPSVCEFYKKLYPTLLPPVPSAATGSNSTASR
jgi:hypothetical protein